MEIVDGMWTPLQKTGFFIKVIEKNQDYYIGVTDYRKYWIHLTSTKRFLYDLKNSNEGTDFEDEAELLKRGLDMLQNPATLKKVCVLQEDKGELLTISMIKAYEFPLKLELELLEASTEHFFEMIIQPLLKTVCDLRSSQNELRELLKKKDCEIDDWRTDGRVPRRNKTNVYNDEAHMSKHQTFEQNFGAEVPELLTALAAISTPESKMKKNEEKPALPTPNQGINLEWIAQIPDQAKPSVQTMEVDILDDASEAGRKCYFCGLSTLSKRKGQKLVTQSYQLTSEYLAAHPQISIYARDIDKRQMIEQDKICKPCFQRAQRFYVRIGETNPDGSQTDKGESSTHVSVEHIEE